MALGAAAITGVGTNGATGAAKVAVSGKSEAIKFANTTNYASAGCIFAGQNDKAKELAKQLTMPHSFANQIPDFSELENIGGLVGSGLGLEIPDQSFFIFYKNHIL